LKQINQREENGAMSQRTGKGLILSGWDRAIDKGERKSIKLIEGQTEGRKALSSDIENNDEQRKGKKKRRLSVARRRTQWALHPRQNGKKPSEQKRREKNIPL